MTWGVPRPGGLSIVQKCVDDRVDGYIANVAKLVEAFVDLGRGAAEAARQTMSSEACSDLVELPGEPPRLRRVVRGSTLGLRCELGQRRRHSSSRASSTPSTRASARIARSRAAVPFVHAAKHIFTADAAPTSPSTTRV